MGSTAKLGKKRLPAWNLGFPHPLCSPWLCFPWSLPALLALQSKKYQCGLSPSHLQASQWLLQVQVCSLTSSG